MSKSRVYQTRSVGQGRGRDGGESLLGIDFCAKGVEETVAKLTGFLTDGNPQARYFACVNPHSVMVAQRDPAFARAISFSSCNTADGIGIVIASCILGGRIRARVCGPDLFKGICMRLNTERPGTRMYFLGATETTLQELVRRFNRDYPSLVVGGAMAPPFRSAFSAEDEDSMVDAINAARVDILWIGLGAPKQEKLALSLQQRLNVRLIAPVGGVFDFYTGRVKLPPEWAQRLGLIWLFRLCQEPRRLIRRNLDAPLFLAQVVRNRLFGGCKHQ